MSSARDIEFLPQLWQQTIPQLKKSRTIPPAALSSQSGCAQHATESDLQKHWWAAQLLMRWCCAQHSRTQITNRGQASENINFSALENHHMSYVHLDTVNTMIGGTGDMRFASFRNVFLRACGAKWRALAIRCCVCVIGDPKWGRCLNSCLPWAFLQFL